MVITSTHPTWVAIESSGSATSTAFDPSTVDDLPEPARRLLTAALRPGTELATAVEVTMTGRIKLGIWMPFSARQILRAGVGFVWAPVVGGRIIRFIGADVLGPDGARMEFRFHGRIPVVNSSGPGVERSAAGRLAAETVAWLPQALTPQAGARWSAGDEQRATVTLAGPSGPVEVGVTVDERGDVSDVDLQRWNDSITPAGYAPFGASVSSMSTDDGVRIAGSGSVGWNRGTPRQHDSVSFEYEVVTARFMP